MNLGDPALSTTQFTTLREFTDQLWGFVGHHLASKAPKKWLWRHAYDWLAGKQPTEFRFMNYGYVKNFDTSMPQTAAGSGAWR